MIYLFCALLGLAALALAGTMREGDSYGRCARLVEQEGGTLFALFAYTTVGDKECDIDLSRYGCAPGAHLAEIALKPVSYTHLDVYKRQGRRWTGTRRCR